MTGVSGSGKTTLIREVLYELLRERLAPGQPRSDSDSEDAAEDSAEWKAVSTAVLEGWEPVDRVVLVDQSPIGRTPRSNPAVYVGAFDAVRDFFASSDEARKRGLRAGAFSFNSPAGQCPRCRGAGFEKIEMQFLSDVFVRCSECHGRRYRPHVLEVVVRPPPDGDKPVGEGWNIARLLEATVEEAMVFLGAFRVPAAARACAALGWLREVGLGYLQLGQPVNTLSGGECQRLKLVGALADASSVRRRKTPRTLYLLDEPTTGLHFDDVRILVEVLQRFVDLGHSAVVIEHNLDVIRAADWVIDMGPEAGIGGGKVVVQGTPRDVEACSGSITGRVLRQQAIRRGGRCRRKSRVEPA